MANWSLYEKKMTIDGTTLRDRQINDMQNAIIEDFESNPSFRQAYINNSTTSTSINIKEEKNSNIKTVLMLPKDSIDIGDIFKFDNENWLCFEANKTNYVEQTGKVQKCNNTLSVYKNGILYSIPCIFSKGNIDSTDGKFITYPTGHYSVTIPSGTITKSDINLRYILNDAPYDTVGIDNSNNGLVIIEIKDGTKNDKDDYINGIAWNEGNPIHSYSIEILNGAEQTVKYGETLTLNVQVKDNGIIVFPIPSLLFETSNGTICTVNENGIVLATNSTGCATITVKLQSDNSIFTSINIIDAPASVVNYNYTLIGENQLDSQILYNQSNTFTATKFDNNDNIISTQFSFEVIGSIPINKYQLTILNDTQCSLKALGYPYSLTLRAIDLNNSQYIDKNISFKSLF